MPAFCAAGDGRAIHQRGLCFGCWAFIGPAGQRSLASGVKADRDKVLARLHDRLSSCLQFGGGNLRRREGQS